MSSPIEIEELRSRYLPETIRMLFVGESPPAKGSFFYDSSAMTRYTQAAFERVYQASFDSQVMFLRFFMDRGCYLDDLSHTPVDNLTGRERDETLQASTQPFARRLAVYQPRVVVVVLKKIIGQVQEAMHQAGYLGPWYSLPFPGHGHQKKYVSGLEQILERHRSMLRPLEVPLKSTSEDKVRPPA